MSEAKRRASALIAEINSAELACRIFEHISGIFGQPRPYPTSPEKSLETVHHTDPKIHKRLMAATYAVIEYLHECIQAGQGPS